MNTLLIVVYGLSALVNAATKPPTSAPIAELQATSVEVPNKSWWIVLAAIFGILACIPFAFACYLGLKGETCFGQRTHGPADFARRKTYFVPMKPSAEPVSNQNDAAKIPSNIELVNVSDMRPKESSLRPPQLSGVTETSTVPIRQPQLSGLTDVPSVPGNRASEFVRLGDVEVEPAKDDAVWARGKMKLAPNGSSLGIYNDDTVAPTTPLHVNKGNTIKAANFEQALDGGWTTLPATSTVASEPADKFDRSLKPKKETSGFSSIELM